MKAVRKKKLTFIFIIILCFFLSISFSIKNDYSQEILGYDSGKYPIEIISFGNSNAQNTVFLIGSLHGDEKETTDVLKGIVKYLLNKKKYLNIYNFKVILIASPALYHVKEPYIRDGEIIYGRRGYLKEYLDKDGYVKEEYMDRLKDFDKLAYYDVLYGSRRKYYRERDKYVDTNRDFQNEILPQTKILKKFIKKLSEDNKNVFTVVFHGYMPDGEVYPEHDTFENNSGYEVDYTAWEMSKSFAEGSGYTASEMYGPAEKYLSRFEGELVRFTSGFDNVYAIDVEIAKNKKGKNVIPSIKGTINLIKNLPIK